MRSPGASGSISLNSQLRISRMARIRRGIGLECGGKRSATPLWIGIQQPTTNETNPDLWESRDEMGEEGWIP